MVYSCTLAAFSPNSFCTRRRSFEWSHFNGGASVCFRTCIRLSAAPAVVQIGLPKPIQTVLEKCEASPNVSIALSNLVNARGAQGRGARALLRALYQRTKGIVLSNVTLYHTQSNKNEDEVYFEFSSAYVRATCKVSRYALEERAWPVVREILAWREISVAEARELFASLRCLRSGERYGRHIIVKRSSLAAALQVAEIFNLTDPGQGATVHRYSVPAEQFVVQLSRMPSPGLRTVAARCPMRSAHRNADRKPSLIIWMNNDGVTGGSLCPVCMEDQNEKSATSDEQKHLHGSLRQRTWSVRFLEGNKALLSAPHSSHSFGRRPSTGNLYSGYIPAVNSSCNRNDKPETEKVSPNCPRESRTCKTGVPDFPAMDRPVGGHVMTDLVKLSDIGKSIAYAYVLAKLKVVNGIGGMDDVDAASMSQDVKDFDRVVRLRTIGTMSRRDCPLKLMMWSDKCSQGANTVRRIDELAWYARQHASMVNEHRESTKLRWRSASLAGGDSISSSEIAERHSDELEDTSNWLPTNVISVSAMRPSSWKEVINSAGVAVAVPAGWEPSAQAWVLFDLDDVQIPEKTPGIGDAVCKAGTYMMRVVRRCSDLSGVCMVMQSGPKGFHVWAELREVRKDPRGWFACDDVRAWYLGIGTRLLEAARRAGVQGGLLDMSSCAPGRFARRCGWRILSDGQPFRARLVTIATSRVRGRKRRSF